jgi:hypothetical protein
MSLLSVEGLRCLADGTAAGGGADDAVDDANGEGAAAAALAPKPNVDEAYGEDGLDTPYTLGTYGGMGGGMSTLITRLPDCNGYGSDDDDDDDTGVGGKATRADGWARSAPDSVDDVDDDDDGDARVSAAADENTLSRSSCSRR